MEDKSVVGRLRRSRLVLQKNVAELGESAGRKWVDEEAEYEQVGNLDRLHQNFAQVWSQHYDQWPGRETVQSRVTRLIFRDEVNEEQAENFWKRYAIVRGEMKLPIPPDFFRGFVWGAVKRWMEIKDEVER
ncbi:MAG TPA: hypothetical protein VMP01_16150 [Pirellulaceae bacterium]|nr:hypothetical protein [Pirellulaceae bacterium]